MPCFRFKHMLICTLAGVCLWATARSSASDNTSPNGNTEKMKEDSQQYFKRAKAKMLKGDYKGAIQDYSEAIRIDPKNALAYVNRGSTYNCLKDDKSSLADYEKAIEIDPKLAIAYYNRGNQMRRLKKFQEALADYAKAISLKEHYADAYYGTAWVYKLLGQYKEAIAFYLKASDEYALLHRDIASYESRVRADELKRKL